jgi:glycosyltransferase 2 family protein
MRKLTENIWFNIILILSLTFLGLWIALYDSLDLVLSTIQSITVAKLLLILVWGLLPYLIWATSLTIMGKQINPSYRFRFGFMNALIGGFVSGITPSSTGGQVAQIGAYKRRGLNAFQGAGLIWLDFYLYSIALVSMTLLLFLFQFKNFESLSITLIFGFGLFINLLIIFVLGMMVVFPNFSRQISDYVVKKILGFSWIKNKEKWVQEFNVSMDHFHDALKEVKQHHSNITILFLLQLLRLSLYFASPFAIAQILGLNLAYIDFFHILALSAFVAMANTFVPLPGASGATESVFVLSFSTIMGKAAAASTMILWRFSSFHFILLLGGYIYIQEKHVHLLKLKKENLYEEDLDE